MVNLTKLVLPGSDLTLTSAAYINEKGEIAGAASLPMVTRAQSSSFRATENTAKSRAAKAISMKRLLTT